MRRSLKDLALSILGEHRTMSVATLREDGWPQATIVAFANEGLVLYVFTPKAGQKAQNILRDARVSACVGADTSRPLDIRGLSLAARAVMVEDRGEYDHAYDLMLARFPEYKVMPRPNPNEVALIRLTPEVLSILDYSKGFGHAELVRVSDQDLAEVIEARRHHWTGTTASG
jgi:general stress protein 26